MERKTNMTNQTALLIIIACFALGIIAWILTGCGTPDKHIAQRPTAVLQARHAELTQRIKDDELGVFWGPMRWVSHAIEEKGVTQENLAIEQELARRR
jgi:hypothetical protein